MNKSKVVLVIGEIIVVFLSMILFWILGEVDKENNKVFSNSINAVQFFASDNLIREFAMRGFPFSDGIRENAYQMYSVIMHEQYLSDEELKAVDNKIYFEEISDKENGVVMDKIFNTSFERVSKLSDIYASIFALMISVQMIIIFLTYLDLKNK